MRHAVMLSLLILLFLIAAPSAADTPSSHNQAGNISVQLAGFENDQGTVKLCLCRSENEYTGDMKAFCTASAALRNKKAEWVFERMPYGTYSIKVFHDENGNSQLDTNVLGKPTERYGFSNNAQGRFGPPPFSRATFSLNSPQLTVAIEVH